MTLDAQATFDDAIRKGLGRAHSVAAAEGREVLPRLVQACLTSEAYDAQTEGSRAAYLHDLVEAAGVRDEVASALAGGLTEGDYWDVAQRYDLACLLAPGTPALRQAVEDGLRSIVDEIAADDDNEHGSLVLDIAEGLARLDPIDGTVFALSQLGRIADPDEVWHYTDVLDDARKADTGIDAAVAVRRQTNPELDALMRVIESPPPPRGGPSGRAPTDLSWAEAKVAIEEQVRGTGQSGMMWRRWGQKAPDDQLRLAAQALADLPRSDAELLRPYLAVFAARVYPLDPQPLIDLLTDDREKVAWFAANALSVIAHPAVRKAALDMAAHGPLRERSVDLLRSNWMPGDEAVIENVLHALTDRDDLHIFGGGLGKLAEEVSSPALVPALLETYERTPCATCRYRVVKVLVKMKALPPGLEAECRWDSYEDTRALVAGASGSIRP